MARWMSLGLTTLTKDGTNQFVLNPTGHHMTAFPSDVQVLLLNHSDQLCDNGLLVSGLLGLLTVRGPEE